MDRFPWWTSDFFVRAEMAGFFGGKRSEGQENKPQTESWSLDLRKMLGKKVPNIFSQMMVVHGDLLY